MRRILFYLILIPIITYSCGSTSKDEDYRCPPPPEGFSEMDLVGTWEAISYVVPEDSDTIKSDTIIIRADGKYKQIIHMVAPVLNYESEWQRWWLEYSEIGVVYLHLEGMNLCAAEPGLSSCANVSRESGGWIDFCRNETTFFNNEGVLIVPGSSDISGNSIQSGELVLFSQSSTYVWKYEYRGP